MKKIPSILLGSVLVVFLATGSAMAAPVYDGSYVDMYLKQTTFPGGLSEDMVYLDAALASTITGHVGSQTGTPLVMFSSTTDILDAASGFATIKAQDDYINNITITAPGYWFTDLIFSVNLAPDNPPPQTDLSVEAMTLAGNNSYNGWYSESDWVPGDNRILVLADPGNLIASVTLNSVAGIGGIDQLKQTEISGLTPVPEPTTMLLLGSGLVGLAAFRRRFTR